MKKNRHNNFMFQSNRVRVQNFYVENPLNKKFVDYCIQNLNDDVVQYLPDYFHNIKTEEDLYNCFKYFEGNNILLSMEDITLDILIGFFVIKIDLQSNQISIGYILFKPYWSKGYASEVLSSFIEYSKEYKGFKKLIGGVEESNLASIKLLQKHNFECYKKEDTTLWFQYILDV